MAAKIRLKRFGKKKAPFYRVVVIDSRAKRDGRAIEEIGLYHPLANPSVIEINSERALYWLGVGAQPSDQVRKLLTLTGDWGTFKGEKDSKSTVEMPAGKLSPDEQIQANADAAEKLKAEKAAADEKAKQEADAAAKAEADEAAKAEAEKAAVADAAPAEDAAAAAPASDEATGPAEPESASEDK
ncbi:30S ribosomal protein S16 [Demequina aestuarii]|uniref:30S ribosomal protein S16 n=1 Tax=Demequina aestuarii TaxID=327095 RepID=UPI000784FCF1|nr:30S ribosomal protein S16 [Demequina aestuarii]